MYGDRGCGISILIQSNTRIISVISKLHALDAQCCILQHSAAARAVLVSDAIIVRDDLSSLEHPRDRQRKVSPGKAFHLKRVVFDHVLDFAELLYVWRSYHIQTG